MHTALCWNACDCRDDPLRGDLADRAVAQIRHVDIARAVDGYTRGKGESRIGAVTRAIVVRKAALDRFSGNGADDTFPGDLANLVVSGIRDEQVAHRIDGDAARLIEARVGAMARSIVVGGAALSRFSGNGADDPFRGDLAN